LKLGLVFAALTAGCAAPTEAMSSEASLSTETWIGHVSYALDRASCGGVCDGALRAVPDEILYDTWARQRASVRVVAFEVWREGVTDWDNPERWRQLDVQVHARTVGEPTFRTRHVPFDKRLGNNARYVVDLVALDPIPGTYAPTRIDECPTGHLAPSGEHVDAVVELYFTVNGVEKRPAGPASVYRVRYQNDRALYAACI